jgi:hypothetical protein
MTRIKKGDIVRIKPEWQDPGDEKYTFVAAEDEHGDRIRIACVDIWPDSFLVPNQIIRVSMLERPCES